MSNNTNTTVVHLKYRSFPVINFIFLVIVLLVILKLLYNMIKNNYCKQAKTTLIYQNIEYGTFPEDYLDEDCCICQDKLYTGNILKLECEHMYHINCANNWFNHRNDCCICREETTIKEYYYGITT